MPSASADQRTIDVDNISIESPGFDFSEGLFIARGLTESAEVEWLVDDNDLTPSISGELHLNNARDECARLRIDHYTEATTLLTTRYSSERCASDNAHHEYDMVLAPHTDHAIGKVKVTLQRERSDHTWEGLGSDWSTLSTLNSNVRINRRPRRHLRVRQRHHGPAHAGVDHRLRQPGVGVQRRPDPPPRQRPPLLVHRSGRLLRHGHPGRQGLHSVGRGQLPAYRRHPDAALHFGS